MQENHEMHAVILDGKTHRCVVWYRPDYGMYSGAIYDDGIAIVRFVDCGKYSPRFIAKPGLANVNFQTVRDLFGILVPLDLASITNAEDRCVISKIVSALKELRQHWVLHGYHTEWTESTAS